MQIVAGKPAQKRAWKLLIQAKIRNQAAVLEAMTGHDGGLRAMAGRVRSGDPDNLEAQAAQKYWPRLFGSDFRRDRDAEGVNALLNYGYAVIRAAVARAIVATGLLPSIGVFHQNRGNPFCLADDVLEPFRPLVDWRVKHLVAESEGETPSLDDRAMRAGLLSLFNETLRVGERRLPVLMAIETAAVSLGDWLCEQQGGLQLPDGLPVAAPDLWDVAEETE